MDRNTLRSFIETANEKSANATEEDKVLYAYFCTAHIYEKDNIPPKMMKKALSAYGQGLTADQVEFIIPTHLSLLANDLDAKTGVILTRDGLYSNHFSLLKNKNGYFYYSELQAVKVLPKDHFILHMKNGKQLYFNAFIFDMFFGVFFEQIIKTLNPGTSQAISDGGSSRTENAEEPEALRRYLQKAKNGDAVAMYNLGAAYNNGIQDLPQDKEKAFFWNHKSAENGYAPGMYWTGYMLERGIGVQTDKAGARRWYEKAAEKGEQKAIDRLHTLKDEEKQAAAEAEAARKAAEEGEAARKAAAEAEAARKAAAEAEAARKAAAEAEAARKAAAEAEAARKAAEAEAARKATAEAEAARKAAAEEATMKSTSKKGQKEDSGYPDNLKKENQNIQEALEAFNKQDYEKTAKLLNAHPMGFFDEKLSDPDALCAIGWMYENGRGVKHREFSAFRAYYKAAEIGSEYGKAGAIRILAGTFSAETVLRLKNPMEQLDQVIGYAAQAIADGNVNVQESVDRLKQLREEVRTLLAINQEIESYDHNFKVTINPQEARKWFNAAFQAHQAKNEKLAELYFMRSAAFGNASAAHDAWVIIDNKFEKRYTIWLERAVAMGHVKDVPNLALQYSRGYGTEKDYQKALLLADKAAKSEIEGAQEAIEKIIMDIADDSELTEGQTN